MTGVEAKTNAGNYGLTYCPGALFGRAGHLTHPTRAPLGDLLLRVPEQPAGVYDAIDR
jgi:hypothetical protein